MKLSIRTWLAWAALNLICLSACTDTHQNGNHDKNTNWLMSCDSSETCGEGLQCVCGVCTTACEASAQCSSFAEGAVCGTLAVSGNACSASEAATSVCTLTCDEATQCAEENDDLSCIGGMCAPEPMGMDSGVDPMVQDAMTVDDAEVSDAEVSDAEVSDAEVSDAEVSDADTSDASIEVPPDVAAGCGASFACQSRATQPGNVKAIVPDADGYVYWTDWGTLDSLDNHRLDGAIKRASKQSGAVETLFDDLERPLKLWLDAQRYYWMRAHPGQLEAGTGKQTLFEAFRDPSTAPPTDEDAGLAFGDDAGVGPADPMWVDTRTYQSPLVANDRLYWVERPSGRVEVHWIPIRGPIGGRSKVAAGASGGGYDFAGLDGDVVYLDNGRSSVIRTEPVPPTGQIQEELVTDPPAFLVTVGSDKLWMIHTSEDERDWVSSMPKTGGRITHVGSAQDYYGRPQPGETVVWLVTGEQAGGRVWQLWSMPKGGGERQLAFTWPAESGIVREDAPAPLWTADGDEAWVYGYGNIIRIRRP